jgi:DNA repair ATPase RecN
MKELDMTHRKYSNEIKNLKEKLAWYAENQQLLEEAENNKEALKNVINILKIELKKKGVSSDKIQYLTLSVPGINLGSLAECIGMRESL